MASMAALLKLAMVDIDILYYSLKVYEYFCYALSMVLKQDNSLH